MKVSELRNSRFLTQEDCEPPIVVTISHVKKQNVPRPDAEPEEKHCLHFKEENVKPLVLIVTNAEKIQELTGSDDSDHWGGKKIVLYRDPDVRYGPEKKGGIRVRAHQAPEADLDGDIPF